MDKVTLRKIALAIEWEGAIGVYEIRSDRFVLGASHSPRIIVGVREKDRVLLDRLVKWTGVGRVNISGVARSQNRSEMAEWQVWGPEAVSLAKKIEPYLVTKYRQAQLVAGYPVGRRQDRVTQEMFDYRRAAAQETKELNQTGPQKAKSEAAKRAEQWINVITALSEDQKMSLLALSIDLEGCINIARRLRKDCLVGVQYEPSIQISQAEHRIALLHIANSLASAGSIVNIGRAIPLPNEAKLKGWRVGGAKAVEIARHLSARSEIKSAQAHLLAQFPIRSVGPTPIPATVRDKREELYLLLAKEKGHYEVALSSIHVSG